MKKSKPFIEYDNKYGNVPKDFQERLNELFVKYKIKEKDEKVLKNAVRDIFNIKKKKLSFVFYFVPKPTPRPRHSKFTASFYVKTNIDYGALFEEFVNLWDDLHFIIDTPTKLVCDTYFPIPASMSRIEKILAELKLIPHISRPDWDNLGKTYSDMIQGSFLKDDSLIYDGRVRKYYSSKPRIELYIEYYDTPGSAFNARKINKWK